MREEFQKRRGYDLLPLLPVLTGRVVDSLEVSERFLWDLRQTISDLVVENYAGHLRAAGPTARAAAFHRGLRRPLRRHDLRRPGRRADGRVLDGRRRASRPARRWPRRRTSTASGSSARSRSRRTTRNAGCSHPATIKALGDRAFCEGINRFVFHRYALQPWLNYRPGMTMGPWGLHYERTQTWWEQSRPWHEYLARCQFLLRQGLFVADICYLQPEARAAGLPRPHQRAAGYDFDSCTPEVVLTRMTVKDGRLVLPDGMSYRLLVLPDRPSDDAAAAAQDQGAGRGRAPRSSGRGR